MAPSRCRRCGYSLTRGAKFCTRCGESFAAVSGEERKRCDRCGRSVSAAARFCNWCGASGSTDVASDQASSSIPDAFDGVEHAGELDLATNAEEEPLNDRQPEPSGLPPRELARPYRGSKARQLGTVLADAGAGIALVGCFLPLVSGVGETIAVIPHLVNEVPHFYAIPASALVIAVMAWGASTGDASRRASYGGSVIAVSSPWTVLLLLTVLAINRVSGWMGVPSYEAVSVGFATLLIGFGLSLAAGFVILQNVVEDQR